MTIITLEDLRRKEIERKKKEAIKIKEIAEKLEKIRKLLDDK
jgi:hypothetical protein